jgi:hypothetical protein
VGSKEKIPWYLSQGISNQDFTLICNQTPLNNVPKASTTKPASNSQKFTVVRNPAEIKCPTTPKITRITLIIHTNCVGADSFIIIFDLINNN